jgi:hypothetical protein
MRTAQAEAEEFLEQPDWPTKGLSFGTK